MNATPPRQAIRDRIFWAWCAAGVASAVIPALLMWGFTVDDALISVRYARHLAMGAGYRFNSVGPITDGVTPLPWAFILAPFANAAPLVVLGRAKCLGLFCWAAASGALGVRIGRAPSPFSVRALHLMMLATSLPVAAHAATGMETALAMALATTAALFTESPCIAGSIAGLAASLRPEMLPWALTLALGLGVRREVSSTFSNRLRVPWTALVLAALPFTVCVLVRLYAFDSPVPLSVYAKPSDWRLGALYSLRGLLMAGVPLAVVLQLRRIVLQKGACALAAAGLVHAVAVAVAGGDWMEYARLFAPVVPSLVLASVLVAGEARRAWWPPLLASALGFLFFVGTGVKGRHVLADREDLIERARPLLAPFHRIASPDVGWVSAATEEAIIDLGGVTDPAIAMLRGSHTSKRIEDFILRERAPDAFLVYVPESTGDVTSWASWRFSRAIDARLAHSEFVRDGFVPLTFLPLGADGRGYVLLGSR